MKNWWLLLCLLLGINIARAQQVLITLKDSIKIKTELVSITAPYLYIKSGWLDLQKIQSVRFENNTEYQKSPELASQLAASGITVYVRKLKAGVGIGVGLDYGGFGGRFSYLLNNHLAVFAGCGYALVGAGYNTGLMARIKPENKLTPTFSLMYGYNAAIQVTGASNYDKLYYGPSLGLGFESKTYRKNYWHFEILVPFRSSQFDEDLATLQNNPNINLYYKPLPVTISFGYNFVF